MAEFSNYLENKLLDHVLNNTAYTSPTTTFVALFTDNPGEGGTGTEVSGGSYARQPLSVGAASSGVCTSDADVVFPQCTSTWGTVTHIGIYDAVTTGNLLMYTPLTTSKVIETDDILKISSGNLTVTLD
jgi:hypothetical protein